MGHGMGSICNCFVAFSNCCHGIAFVDLISIKYIFKVTVAVKKMYKTICIVVFLSLLINEGESLYCYRCNSNHPGCGTPFNWWWYWGETCPEYDDKCVKIIERKGAETIITRECLSSVRSFRKDIPADRYEGCRPAAKDVHLGHYVNNSIHQLDIHRDYYDQVTWCFCYFDHRCNGATTIVLPTFLLLSLIALQQFTT